MKQSFFGPKPELQINLGKCYDLSAYGLKESQFRNGKVFGMVTQEPEIPPAASLLDFNLKLAYECMIN